MQMPMKMAVVAAMFFMSVMFMFIGHSVLSKKLWATRTLTAREYMENPPRTWPGLLMMTAGVILVMVAITSAVVLFI